MVSYVTPKKNTQFIFYISLTSQASRPQFQSNPTLASGDAKVSIDGGSLANLATLPAVTPASSKLVKVTLSSDEMNGDNIAVLLSDASGAEWDDLMLLIQTSARQMDDPIAVNSVQTGAITAASFAANALDAVWSVATRLLTAGTNIVLAKGTGVTGLNDLDAAGVRTAVGLASANLDTQLDALPTANENADALLDRTDGVETNFTVRQVLRLIGAVLLGKSSNAGKTFRDLNDSKNRIVGTVDEDNNRTAVTRDAS